MTALQLRDNAWEKSNLILSWVRGREVSFDQHNTQSEVSNYCWNSFKDFIQKEKSSISEYTIIEPSAGTGSFYNLLPINNRIGIDIEKFSSHPQYIQADFLTWLPKQNNSKYITIGNPPFGYRGWLALSFLNHAAEFSDYVGFILPMSFQSDGKGSPKHRVKGMVLVHHEILPDGLFIKSSGDKTSVNTLWQIWKKGENKLKVPDQSICDEYIELFTVDQRKERLCGAVKMKTCNTFLQRTFYTLAPTLVKDFSEVKYCCGYGINFKKNKREIIQVLKNTDWVKYSNLATHNCRHISMYHIRQAIIDNYICKK